MNNGDRSLSTASAMHQHLFAPCPRCDRHVRLSEARCPFCDGALPSRTVRFVRGESVSRAALVALSSALAAACDERSSSPEPAHTISTSAPLLDAHEAATPSVTVTAEGSTEAGPQQTITVVVDAAAYDAAAQVVSEQSAARPSASDVPTGAANSLSGLGLTGYGAAYGSPPFGPDTRNIGRGPSGEATLTGLQPNEPRLRAFLRARHSQIVACYQRELTNNPTAFGAIEVQFGVRSNATLSDVTVRAPSLAPSLAACVRTRFAVMRAPPAFEELGRITARYTFSVRR
ncbi:MAG: hypothetical protein U0269_06590 [Polyangiales bacterium]